MGQRIQPQYGLLINGRGSQFPPRLLLKNVQHEPKRFVGHLYLLEYAKGALRLHNSAPIAVKLFVQRFIGLLIVHLLDASLNQLLETPVARFQGAIEGSSFQRNAEPRGLVDRVYLGVTRDAIIVLIRVACAYAPAQTEIRASVRTVRRSMNRSIVASRQYPVFAHDHRSYLPRIAGGPRAHQLREQEKILVPGRSVHASP